jgi:signal transduction histidine kinase
LRPNLYGLFVGISVVIPLLFSIPIVLAAFYYPRRGVIFAGAVSAGYLLRVTQMSLTSRESKADLVITFADNGCWIPPAEKKKIFEKGNGKNTGHGHFLAREILAITGGTIHENSTFGEGAVFEIIIPKGAYRKPE